LGFPSGKSLFTVKFAKEKAAKALRENSESGITLTCGAQE
jgi:hypothetical protein